MQNRQPNILLLVPDGMQAEPLESGSQCHTPNFQRLIDRGMQFHRAYTNSPTCSPARASLMTGLLPHNHGVLQVEHNVDPDQSVLREQYPHWAQRLSEAGYRTAYFGKWHIERTGELERFGWQVNQSDAGAAQRQLGRGQTSGLSELLESSTLCRYKEGPEGYNRILHYAVTEVPPEQRPFGRTVDQASAFLTEVSREDTPWACCVSLAEPNVPLIAGQRAFSHYDPDKLSLPPNCHDDMADRPELYQREKHVYRDITDHEWLEARAVYYALISEIDEQFGKIYRQLEESGQLENTIIIVASDHGRYVGAHGFDAHNIGAFEEIYRIPLIISGPGIKPGTSTTGLVSIADFCPTILELAGAEPIEGIDSRSFTPLLFDPDGTREQFTQAYAEYHGARFLLTQRILWEGAWKFIFNPFAFDELYDLAHDPYEMKNLAIFDEHQERCRKMMRSIWGMVRDTEDLSLLETHYSPLRLAVVGPNAE